ncbi:MAG: SCP-2 sterol transfer family protein [Thiotrichaceae bacterium]|nr:SCP-2 sterol transfer family protein [Thiotrichaceae bacterium]
MSEMFSEEWMTEFKTGWNNEPGIKDALAEIGFSSNIAFGIKGDSAALGVIVVKNGECTYAGALDGQDLDWDIRADKKNWLKWANKGIGMAGLGMAYASGKMKFVTGDYGSMMKSPKMAGPFIKCFGLMKSIESS